MFPARTSLSFSISTTERRLVLRRLYDCLIVGYNDAERGRVVYASHRSSGRGLAREPTKT